MSIVSKSLDRLQQQFLALQAKGGKVPCVLTETRFEHDKDGPCGNYAPPAIERLWTQPGFFSIELGGLFELKYEGANEAGRIIASGCQRKATFWGDGDAYRDWEPLAAQATTLVRDVAELARMFPPSVTRRHERSGDMLQWIYVIYDLAWRRIPDVPLRADRMVCRCFPSGLIGSIPESTFLNRPKNPEPKLASPLDDISAWINSIPNPPTEVHAELDDVISASVTAIDVLLDIAEKKFAETPTGQAPVTPVTPLVGKPGEVPPNRAQEVASQYDAAAEAIGKANPTDREAHNRHVQTCKENGVKVWYQFSTWARYLRLWRGTTGQQKNTPRRGRKGRSLLKGADE